MLKVARRPLAAPKRGLYIEMGTFVECNADILKVFGPKDLVEPTKKFNPKTDKKVDYSDFVYEDLAAKAEEEAAAEAPEKKAPAKAPGSGATKTAPKKVSKPKKE